MHFVMVAQNLSDGKSYMLKDAFLPSATGRICFRVAPDIPRDSGFDEDFIQRKQEIAEVIQRIKAQMKEYGVTLADLGASNSGVQRKAAKTKSTAPAKYRGPNGELWAGGLGRKPEWVRALLAEGKNIEDYLI